MAKIVAVDDDPAGQRLIKYMLSAEGHEVITATNGIQGLQMVNQQSPALVILDVMLPGIDGFEVCRRLRSGASTKNIPILMLSGKSQTSDRDTALKLGANEYLVKPVDRKNLIEKVSQLLSEQDQSHVKKAKVLAFIGARGGAGTSTVTINLAAALEKKGKSTILVDMNPSYSAIGDLIGLKAETSIAVLFKGTSGTIDVNQLRSLLEQHDSGISLLWGETNPDESGMYNPANVKILFSELSALADYIIVDIPASPTDNSIAVLGLADSVTLVTGAGKESIDRLDNSVSHLVRFGTDREKINVLAVDKTGTQDIQRLSGQRSAGGYELSGIIHFCAEDCAKAEAEANPVILFAPESDIARDINELASKLVQ